jgi:hypothetical protein
MSDWSESSQRAASTILTYLGIAQEPSAEPGTDTRRDMIAHIVALACTENQKPLLEAMKDILDGFGINGPDYVIPSNAEFDEGDTWIIKTASAAIAKAT